jgi:hypothetical protein
MFDCLSKVVEKYVFDPWIFMNHLLSQLQQSDVQYDLKAVVTDVLVDLHVIIMATSMPIKKTSIVKVLQSDIRSRYRF